ncbi:C-C motif chemokine 19-like [Engraulis encrasicolus]|uniref:C-C motif chemokine 19-like n=1 Tax=Engraulis encrasicolus TaxID=184585 RepID=UPI002FCFE2A7
MLLLHTSVLLLVACGMWNSATGQVAVDCCLSANAKAFPLKNVASYKHQTTAEGCSIDATLIITKKGKILCAPPKSKAPRWLRRIFKAIDNQTNGKQEGPRPPKKGRHSKRKGGKNSRRSG